MPLITLKGMICTGHGCWPPRPSVEGTSLFDVEGIPVHLQTHAWAVHCCPPCHDSVLAEGSKLFDVGGLEVGRIGDPVACGSLVAEGHPLFDITE
ncbi:MAG: PAAR domain-containing protein [Synergistaceae bacterium]|nr:PAAR domain-containing protein [Synergistaceae bacterium]